MALAPAVAQSWVAKTPSPPERAPHQHVVARLQLVRLVAEQHAVGGGEGQRVAGGLLPGQVLGPGHQLADCTRQNWAKEPSGVS